MHHSKALRRILSIACAGMVLLGASTAQASAATAHDSFYSQVGSTPLSQLAPGTVLKTRTIPYRIQDLALPLKVTQLLYRSTDALGQPSANVTSVIEPAFNSLFGTLRVLSYQSAYDSLNPDDEPSVSIAGGKSSGAIAMNIETALIAPFLVQGYSVVVSDTEGQKADFAAGPEYGYNTLDSLRAAYGSPLVNIPSFAKTALIGYSGGAIASEWASELAPSYAPDIDRRLVGTAIGGVLVDPAHNFHYVEGSDTWAAVMAMALVGVSRSYQLDLRQYLNAYGKQVYDDVQAGFLLDVLPKYPNLTWQQIARPEYPFPETIPEYVATVNKLRMGTGGTPNNPLMITEGTDGSGDGTADDKPGIGPGDGVMVSGDVRSLARDYCGRGVPIKFTEVAKGHGETILKWFGQTLGWVNGRMAGLRAPNDCATIPEGNSLDPVVLMQLGP